MAPSNAVTRTDALHWLHFRCHSTSTYTEACRAFVHGAAMAPSNAVGSTDALHRLRFRRPGISCVGAMRQIETCSPNSKTITTGSRS
ncbi:hypothetical protein CRG98_034973 [Punica granatum]|uniref:Uncharacterized protein n=1 Tax=Punica granatum TaxID=22663 RepID=A0A2I0IKU0_PUNGR|nr:hypothetical protein CRG98_034973 [Punica granatum]